MTNAVMPWYPPSEYVRPWKLVTLLFGIGCSSLERSTMRRQTEMWALVLSWAYSHIPVVVGALISGYYLACIQKVKDD